MKRTVLAALIAALALPLVAQDGKIDLHYSLKKGEKLSFSLTHALAVKMDKVPEPFQGVLPEDPIAIKFEGTVDLEVTEVADNGAAQLNGKWRTAKAKGHIVVNDIDFEYDAAKAGAEKPKANEDPALGGFGDLQDQLARMVRTPLKLSVDRQGKISVVEGSGKLGEIESIFRSLNGLMGPLAKGPVAPGEVWKDELKLGMPGLAGNVNIKIRSESKVDGAEQLDGKDVAVIKTKFVVGAGPGEKEEAPTGLDAKIKTEGDGEGKTLFSPKEGRAVKSASSLKVKVTAMIPNPGGGDEMELKAVLKVETGHTLLK